MSHYVNVILTNLFYYLLSRFSVTVSQSLIIFSFFIVNILIMWYNLDGNEFAFVLKKAETGERYGKQGRYYICAA